MPESRQFSLLRQLRFAPYFATQFLGSFNDNVLRNGVVILIAFEGARVAGGNVPLIANFAGALYLLPFFLFSAIAGQLADKYEKSLLIRRIKLLEIALTILAAFALLAGSTAILLFTLFLMGARASLIGPVTYSWLPQQLATDELIGGNALVESSTYAAIVLGLIVAGLTVAIGRGNPALLAGCLLVIALLGYGASRAIPLTKAAAPDLPLAWNPWTETLRILRLAREERSVFLSILGISWFWFFGAVLVLQIPAYTHATLNGGETISTLLLLSFASGVAIGALLCEAMSAHRIELGLVPFGSIGLSVFAANLYFAEPAAGLGTIGTVAGFLQQPGSWRVLMDLALLGAFGGFYSVPLYALIQERADREHLSRVIAANNVINALFVVAAALLAIALLSFGLSIPQLFLVLALLNALVAAYIFSLLPEFLIRFLVWILINSLYRIRTSGLENIPLEGAAVLVCNHVSFADALIVGGTIRRPVRFVMYYKIFEIPLLKVLFSTAKAIPIASSREDEALLRDAFDQIDAELRSGHLVCLFPEGAITRDGEIQNFRPGIEAIVERCPVPVIPIALCGMWGSWFSHRKTGGLRRIPGRLFARITVRLGEPVKAKDASAAGLELLVRTLRGDNR